jgi:hypothetical protein
MHRVFIGLGDKLGNLMCHFHGDTITGAFQSHSGLQKQKDCAFRLLE